MLGFSELQPLVQVSFQLLLECIHLLLLILDQLGLSGDDLLVAVLHVGFTLLRLHLLAANLNLVRFLILLLFSKVLLDSLLVQKSGAKFESQR